MDYDFYYCVYFWVTPDIQDNPNIGHWLGVSHIVLNCLCYYILKEIVKDKTLIMVTHKPSVLSLVDRLIVMDEGKIVADGPKEEVLKALTGKKKTSQNKAQNG